MSALDDPADLTPLAETVAALDELVQAGKIRAYGLSNETPWGVMAHLRESEHAQRTRAVSIQNPYNLLNRSYEVGLAEISLRENIGLLAYSPLAFGLLSGKYRTKPWQPEWRIVRYSRFTRYTKPQGFAAVERYAQIAAQAGLSLTQMALAFVNSRPFVTANIIGATMVHDELVNIFGANFRCVDKGFGQNKPVDVVIRPEDVELVKPEDGILTGHVTHSIFKGVHYEMEVTTENGYEWLVQSTRMFELGQAVGITVDPFNIQIMNKPASEDEEAIVNE